MSLPECCMPRPLRGYFSFHSHTVVTAAALHEQIRGGEPVRASCVILYVEQRRSPSSSTSNLKMRHAPLPPVCSDAWSHLTNASSSKCSVPTYAVMKSVVVVDCAAALAPARGTRGSLRLINNRWRRSRVEARHTAQNSSALSAAAGHWHPRVVAGPRVTCLQIKRASRCCRVAARFERASHPRLRTARRSRPVAASDASPARAPHGSARRGSARRLSHRRRSRCRCWRHHQRATNAHAVRVRPCGSAACVDRVHSR